MKERGKPTEHERRDWVVILIILLIGFLCVILAGERAIRFAPFWKLDANMGSNLNPDSDFLTTRPTGYFEPLDPSILTQPVWINAFLTPGASFPTRTPMPPTNTPLPTNTLPAPTNTPTRILPSLTPTQPFFPPPTRTPRPNTPLPPTATSIPPATAIPVDLSLTKTDGSGIYAPGSTVTYTVVVTNNGPNTVTGATISDAKPAQITTWGWCVAPCAPVANTSGNLGATINLASGASVTYTILANIDPSATGNLVNTATISVPPGYTDSAPGNNSATDTNTPSAVADLQITKTDNATHYVANATKTYVIVVSNAGPSNVTGATVTDAFTNPNILPGSVTWTCSGTGGGICTASGSGNISDLVNLPAGAYVTYLVDVTVVNSPSGDLVNTAMVSEPPGTTDPVPGNNSATDMDTLIIVDTPPSEISLPPDNEIYQLPLGGVLTLNITTTVNGNPGPDLIFYEYLNGSFVYMDLIQIQIGDGSNWYTVFYWGDEIRDTNTNIDYTSLPCPPPPPPDEGPYPPDCPPGGPLYEPDERQVPPDYFYPYTSISRGIAIDIDLPAIPQGTYPYIRVISPPGDTNGLEIDAIEVLP